MAEENPVNENPVNVSWAHDAQQITTIYKKMITNKLDSNENIEDLGDLTLLSGVSVYPARIKCAILSCYTIESAIKNDQNIITTE